jgi:beta-phosphoglucomutase-like phosphatase (HAD superfamily)
VKPKALIFDVDGTLADTEEAHRRAFNRAFQRFGLPWHWDHEEYRRLLDVAGGKERLAAYIAGKPMLGGETARWLARIPEIHAEKTRLYGAMVGGGALTLREGVLRLIDEALTAGCRLAIATTTSPENVDALLRSALGERGRELFAVVACGDEVPAKKPAPDIYRLALQRLGLGAADAVAFEDSEHGLAAARAAGVWTVVTPTYWTADGDFSGAGLVLPSLGGPTRPIPGEPGGRLRDAAWLTFAELAARRSRLAEAA